MTIEQYNYIKGIITNLHVVIAKDLDMPCEEVYKVIRSFYRKRGRNNHLNT